MVEFEEFEDSSNTYTRIDDMHTVQRYMHEYILCSKACTSTDKGKGSFEHSAQNNYTLGEWGGYMITERLKNHMQHQVDRGDSDYRELDCKTCNIKSAR